MVSVKPVAAIFGVVALGAVSAVVLAPAANAEGEYMAIAYSPSEEVFGAIRNFPTREAATAQAMQTCVAQPQRPSDCKVVVTASPPDRCVALATGPTAGEYAGGSGLTPEEAEANAMLHSDGKIGLSFCNGPAASGPFPAHPQ